MNKKRMIAQLKAHEGVMLKPYTCPSGKLTIGVGRNLTDKGITQEECDHLLINDINYFWDQLIITLPWVLELDEVRQHVLLDMAFNMGIKGLSTFINTLGHVKNKNYTLAADNMLKSKWASQVGQRAKTLSKMMATGKAPSFK